MHLAQEINYSQDFFSRNPTAGAFSSVGALVSALLPNVIVFAGVFFFILILYSGFLLIIYGGQFNPPAMVAKAKAMITYALMGFLIVVAAYFILQIIGTVTGVNFVNLPLSL